MADQKISARIAASTLTGAEIVGVIQSAADRQTTTQDIADLAAGALPYKSYAFFLTISSGPSFSAADLINNFSGITFSFTSLSNGVFRITASSASFVSGKTVILGLSADNAGVPYFVNGAATSTTQATVNLTKYDGSQTSTPLITSQFIELRVYN